MECLEKAKAEHLRAINEMLGTAGSPYATTRQIDSTDHTHTSPKRGRLRAHQQQHHHDTQWALDSQGCTSTLSSIGPSQASSVGAHPSSTSGTPSPMMGVAATPIEDPFALPGDLPRKKPAAKAQRTQQNARGNTEERYRRLVEELGVLTESVPGAMVGGQPAEGGVTERIPLRTVQPPVLPLRSTPVLPPLVAAEEGGGGSAVVSPVQRARQMEQEQRDVEWESRQKQYAAREQERIDRRERRGKRKEERAEGVLRAKATVVVEEVKVTEVTVVKVEVRCPPKPTALVQLPEDCVRDETHARVCQHRKERAIVESEELVERMDISEHDPRTLQYLAREEADTVEGKLIQELQEERDAARERDAAEVARLHTWETVRETVWEQQAVRTFLEEDEATAHTDLSASIAAELALIHLSSIDTPLHPIHAASQERHLRDTICHTETTLFPQFYLLQLEDHHLVVWLAMQEKMLKTLEEVYEECRRGATHISYEGLEEGVRVSVEKQEGVERGLVFAALSEAKLLLLDRFAWLANCHEVDERFKIEADWEMQFRDATYDHPTSLSVVSWVQRKTKAYNEDQMRCFLQSTASTFEATELEEAKEREAVFEHRAHNNAMIQRSAELAKRDAIQAAINAAFEAQTAITEKEEQEKHREEEERQERQKEADAKKAAKKAPRKTSTTRKKK